MGGDVCRLERPGGGGFGDPLARDPERVLAGVLEGAVSAAAAEREYGVVLTAAGGSWRVDEAATRARRAEMVRARPHPR